MVAMRQTQTSSERGATMIEYAVGVALIAIIALIGVRAMGHKTGEVHCKVTGEGILQGTNYKWDGKKCAKSGLGLPGS